MRYIVTFFVTLCLISAVLSAGSIKLDEVKWIQSQRSGEKIQLSTNALDTSEKTLKLIQKKYQKSDKKTFQEAMEQRQLYEQKYRKSTIDKGINIRKKLHNDLSVSHSQIKKRLLKSTNNQFDGIEQGNNELVIANKYIYTYSAPTLQILTYNQTKITKIASFTYDFPIIFRDMHARDNFVAIILQQARPNITIIRIYENMGTELKILREYKKQGYYVQSREYDFEVLVLIVQEMKSAKLDYTWSISDVGEVNETVFEGASGNQTAKNVGNSARILAKIPIKPQKFNNFAFATYLFCDYTWDLVLTDNLKIIIPANNYNKTSYKTTFQYLQFNPCKNQQWGVSKWITLPGIFYSAFQTQDYNNYLRVVLLHTKNQENTVGYVSVAKIPFNSFNPEEGSVYHDLGVDGVGFVSCRFRKDLVYLNFQNGVIRTFSTTYGFVVGDVKQQFRLLHLYPYGPNHIIGIGSTPQKFDVGIVLFYADNLQLVQKQSLKIQGQSNAFFNDGWLSYQTLQFDWQNKRITFPLFIAQDEPYRSGFYQVYVNPQQNCMSSLPVSNPCTSRQSTASLDKLVKHWDNSSQYNWNIDSSEYITRSGILSSNKKSILITKSPCQIQAREIKPKQTGLNSSPNAQNKQFLFVDLCL